MTAPPQILEQRGEYEEDRACALFSSFRAEPQLWLAPG
jgi:hypothetical protein